MNDDGLRMPHKICCHFERIADERLANFAQRFILITSIHSLAYGFATAAVVFTKMAGVRPADGAFWELWLFIDGEVVVVDKPMTVKLDLCNEYLNIYKLLWIDAVSILMRGRTPVCAPPWHFRRQSVCLGIMVFIGLRAHNILRQHGVHRFGKSNFGARQAGVCSRESFSKYT